MEGIADVNILLLAISAGRATFQKLRFQFLFFDVKNTSCGQADIDGLDGLNRVECSEYENELLYSIVLYNRQGVARG